MPIAPDSSGSTAVTVAAALAVVDITAAAAGAWCYAWAVLSTGATTQISVPASAGWTQLQVAQTAAGTAGSSFSLYRRQKQAGDTTFTFTWITNAKGVFAWASYTGLNNAGPDEQSAIAINDTTTRTAVPTPTATPAGSGRWALAFFGQRSSNATFKPTAWTPDAALVERIEADNSIAASAPWMGADIEDSNGTVTVAAHSYTATSNVSQSHDGSALLFLVPAPAAAAAATVTSARGRAAATRGRSSIIRPPAAPAAPPPAAARPRRPPAAPSSASSRSAPARPAPARGRAGRALAALAPRLPGRRASARVITATGTTVTPPPPASSIPAFPPDILKPWRKHLWPRRPALPPPAEALEVLTQSPPGPVPPGPGGEPAQARPAAAGPGQRGQAGGAVAALVAASARRAARTVETGRALQDPRVADAVFYWQQRRTRRGDK